MKNIKINFLFIKKIVNLRIERTKIILFFWRLIENLKLLI